MLQAYVFTRNGGPEVEALVEREVPAPGSGELLAGAERALRSVEDGHAFGRTVTGVAL
ncbi:hypothetical protein ACWCXX_05800 [Streptomyces sp. NPDC001732]